MKHKTSSLYYVGVDGGGTKCRAELYNPQGDLLGSGVAGSANIARQGNTAEQSILTAVSKAFEAATIDQQHLGDAVVCAGLAGANLPSAAAALKQWRHPFQTFHFTSDLHTALYGAHAGQNGAVLVMGTGSCAAALTDGKLTQLGGHGFLLGDKGSGAWLGKQAIMYSLEALDGVVPHGPLVEAVCNHYHSQSATDIVDRLIQANPGVFGEICPIILKLASDDDPTARALVERGSAYLSAIARKALRLSGGNLVIAGGVATAMTPWLDDDIRSALRPTQFGPEWGAILLYQNGGLGDLS
ncbi:BadF/BadG/BcrA/BcrD ATPase family protein [Pseudidiomarina sp. E22-M8]|uniref:BadF/BadG/BcrA/BcrD ATPase family protein n=1 Tax=Pseudidiomarina sp. E22-M8 TaxID=3424768 RepID=UPI00403C6F4E